MWLFYRDVLGKMGAAIRKAAFDVKSWAGFVAWVAAIFNRQLGRWINEQWEGFDWRWMLVPIAIAGCWYFLCAVYEKYAELENAYAAKTAKLSSRVAELDAKLDERDKAKARKARIDAIIGEANLLHQAIIQAGKARDFVSVQGHVDDWEKRASLAVSEEFPQSMSLFGSNAGLDNGTVYQGSQVASNLRKRLEFRVIRLQQILNA